MKRISLVIFAAGFSSRFGRQKLVQEIRGRKIIEILIETVSSLPLEKKYIVIKKGDEDLKRIISKGFIILENHNPEKGMSESIKIAIKALPETSEGIMMLLGDQPLVPVSHLGKILVEFESTNRGIAATRYNGEIRNPAIFSRKYFSDLLELNGDIGGRKLFEAFRDDIKTVELDDGRMLEDLDYPQDLAKIREIYDALHLYTDTGGSMENRTGVSFENAMRLMQETEWRRLGLFTVPLAESCGMISGKDVFSPVDCPPIRKSVMDGYAINSGIFDSPSHLPLELRITGRITAGESSIKLDSTEHCAEILTGGEMPENADCVVRYEDVSRNGDRIIINRIFRKGENVAAAGEDFKTGDLILKKGEIIRPSHVSALAQCMCGSVNVFEVIRVSVISTGNELSDTGRPGSIPNSTGTLLVNWLNNSYMAGLNEGIYPDDVEEIREEIMKCREKSHIIIITGGSGNSDQDLVHTSLNGISTTVFRGVRVRPGKTFSLHNMDGLPVFSMSGLPVAALLPLIPFMEELVKNLTGYDPDSVKKGKLESDLQCSEKYTSIVPVRIEWNESGYAVKPVIGKVSGKISALLENSSYIILREGVQACRRGDIVETHRGRW